MRLRPQRHYRRGATLVEAAVVFLVFLTAILGMIDVGVGVLNYHAVAHAARQGARMASVRGELAPSSMGNWGPATYGAVPATDSGDIAKALVGKLVGLDPSQATFKVEWPESSNKEGKQVKVTVTYTYQPMTTLALSAPITLSSTSVMLITH